MARAAEPPHPRRSTGRCSRSSAALGTGAAWLVVVIQDAPTRYAGLAWLVAGFIFYLLYRRRLRVPLRVTSRAPVPLGAALALEYRSILVPVVAGPESHEAVELAARLATERAGRIVLLRVIVVPLELPLDADLTEQLDEANHLLDELRATAEGYGVRTVERVVRARKAGRAIVDEAERRGIGDHRARRAARTAPRDLRPHRGLRPEARAVAGDGCGRYAARRDVPHAHARSLPRCSSRSVSRCSSSRSGTEAASACCSDRCSWPPARAGSGSSGGEPTSGEEAPRAQARARRTGALLGRVRRDRVVDLLRARRPRRERARLHAARPARVSASSSSSWPCRTRKGPRRCRRPAARQRSSAARSNDLFGFMTGWSLFLDYLIVIALSAIFLPHYLAGALQVERARPFALGRRRRGVA